MGGYIIDPPGVNPIRHLLPYKKKKKTLLRARPLDATTNDNSPGRERQKARKKSLAAMKCHDLLKCISFDGKREIALKQVVVAGVPRNIKAYEEHITMVKEPGSLFIGSATPTVEMLLEF